MPAETRWWHREGDKVVCTLCPRECHIPDGGRGFCFVRANEGGRLQLTTWGRSSGFCVDPIEKKPLNHFLPGTPVLSFGTAGCNLGCKFCQNWDISKSRQMDRIAEQATPEAIIESAVRAGCRSVAFTYNDPVIWAEYAIDIARVARREGIRTVAVTAGYISPDARREFYRWMDAANIDLKAFSETFYRALTQTHLEPVLDTLRYLKHETDVWFEITTLIIPGENDDPDETRRMCRWIVDNLGVDVPLHFSAFHPDFKMRDKPRTPPEALSAARDIALACGIEYVYVGNVYDKQRQSTWCPRCGGLLIERDWYELGASHLDGSRCGHCGHTIPGLFEQACGTWGRRRQPLTIGRSDRGPEVGAARQPDVVPSSTPARAAERAESPVEREMTAPVPNPKITFEPAEIDALLARAQRRVEATVRDTPSAGPLPDALADAPAYGMFVSLRRGTQLRACRGRWGGPLTRLGPLLDAVCVDAARSDPRFPAIVTAELPYVALDISVMFNPRAVSARGEDRIRAVSVGTHGLVLKHPRGRGLLLPHVATESNWDEKTFLDGVCRKAGLPTDTWRRDPDAQIMTFETRLFTAGPAQRELDPRDLGGRLLQTLIDGANRMLSDPSAPGPEDGALVLKHAEELGLYLQTRSGLNSTAVGRGQHLVDLMRVAVNALRKLGHERGRAVDPVTQLTLLWQPIPLRSADFPDRHRGLARQAVLARRDGRWSLVLPGQHTGPDPVAAALENVGARPDDWRGSSKVHVTAFRPLAFEARQRPDSARVRRPAQAGQFYPAEPAEVIRHVDECLALGRREAGADPRAHRAVMLPHAGWAYCGRTIGRTLARTVIPDTVVIIGPKHTRPGRNWSVPPHSAWELPGATVPVAADLATALLDRVPQLACDAEAHRQEHGSEVLIPFLHRLNPALRVLPIVIGQSSYEQTEPLAAALAGLCDTGDDAEDGRPLLVISSDMNHFAPEPENRRLDHMALDAMATGDPANLYHTCVENRISMCGFIPACIVMQALLRETPHLAPSLVDYCNSASTNGDTSRVVGYAGVLLD